MKRRNNARLLHALVTCQVKWAVKQQVLSLCLSLGSEFRNSESEEEEEEQGLIVALRHRAIATGCCGSWYICGSEKASGEAAACCFQRRIARYICISKGMGRDIEKGKSRKHLLLPRRLMIRFDSTLFFLPATSASTTCLCLSLCDSTGIVISCSVITTASPASGSSTLSW